MTFPEQEHKLETKGFDPDTRVGFRLDGRRRPRRRDAPAAAARGRAAPAGLTPGEPYGDDVKREALMRFARAYADGDRAGTRRSPRCSSGVAAGPLGVDPVTAVLSLGESYLFVQGPPGSGKTWQGARMAIALMRAGKRIGVTSLSHKAIHNLLRAIQHEAGRQGFTFRGVKRGDEDAETRLRPPVRS